MEFIQSKDNKTIKRIVSLGQRKIVINMVNILLKVFVLSVIFHLMV